MKKVCWPYFDPEYDSLSERIYGPTCRVCIDNESMQECTIVKVDSVNKQGLLLEVVQVLTDLNLTITKSYISSDAGWFMDVFHCKDENGNKLTDQKIIDHIKQGIGTTRGSENRVMKAKNNANKEIYRPEQTAIEMTGTDRPGLFSEISAALTDLHCNVVEAHAWSHNARLACVAYISDQSTDTPIADPQRLATIEDHLTTVLKADAAPIPTTTQTHRQGKNTSTTQVERRLHQLMLSVGDFDGPIRRSEALKERTAKVEIDSWEEKGYWVVSIECKDRARLMFDTVCTLTDMQYSIFHASISSHGDYAFQAGNIGSNISIYPNNDACFGEEYFIRHMNGYTRDTESEKKRVIKCLEAAIERRVCEGVRMELCANNRVGLLSDITRVLRENGLAVDRADVETQGEKAVHAFYVRDISGKEVKDTQMVESMKREIHPILLQLKKEDLVSSASNETHSFSFGDMLKSQMERFSTNFITL